MSGAERQSLAGEGARPAAAGSSFYLAMRILPKEQREAMYQVYAFCRAVDDIADDPGSRERELVKRLGEPRRNHPARLADSSHS